MTDQLKELQEVEVEEIQEDALPRVIDYEEALEAILFAAGHPVTYETLAKTFEIPVSELRSIVYDYAQKYNSDYIHRGVTLVTFDSCCQLCTKPGYLAEIRQVLGIRKSSGTLSASTIEALTIVAYQQPVTRAYVDAIRNADSSYAMTNLLDRGLIQPVGRKDVPGRPILYGTTNAFLRCFGLNSLDDPPGNTGNAQTIFMSMDERLGLTTSGEGEQLTLDEAFVEDEVLRPTAPDSIPESDEEDELGNATEEAERNND